MRLDMHFHSTLSDGGNTPEVLMNKAVDLDMDFIALTDHDHISVGFKEQLEHFGIDSCQSVEISSCNYDHNKSMHLTAYAEEFTGALHDILENTKDKKQKLISCQLDKFIEKGFYINKEDFYLYFQSIGQKLETLNKFNIAQYIYLDQRNIELVTKICGVELNILGFYFIFCKKEGDLFGEYGVLKDDYEPSVEEVALQVFNNKGIISIAHPNFTFRKGISEFESVLPDYIDKGINAVEINAKATKEWVGYILVLQKKYGFLLTFGSDYHRGLDLDDKHGGFGEVNGLVSKEIVRKNYDIFRKMLI